jgi:putative ABC transport system permease protein
MLLGEIIRVALQSIRANFFRALLTMLGIIIGVAAVITMVALGAGAQRAIDAQIEALGANILTVSASGRLSRGVARDQMTLTVADARALEAQGRYVQAAVPEINTRMQIKFKNRNLNVTLIGTTPNYDDVRGFDIGLGRMFSSSDDQGRRRVVVVGADIPTELGVAPMELLGGTLLIRALPFEVIGIFQPKGAVGFGSPDNDIWIPLNTAQLRVTGTDRLQSISVQVASGVSLEKAMVDIERVIRKEHRLLPGRDNDFTIYDSKQFLNTRQEATEIFTYLLAGIAGVSLLVGGIGIMNIMLVTVTERTREIGVRMALGATRRNILMQFLVEAMILCLLGGIVGIATGWGTASLLSRFAGWQTLVSPMAVGAAFAFSAGVGLFFGIWPARRAARMDPIEALRYE